MKGILQLAYHGPFMNGDSAILPLTLLRIMGKTTARNANHRDDNALATKHSIDEMLLLIKEIFLCLLTFHRFLSAEIFLSKPRDVCSTH